MVRALVSISLAFALTGTVASAQAQSQTEGQPQAQSQAQSQAQPQAQTQDKSPDVKKDDPVPPAREPTKPEQGGKQEPGNAAALSNGVLTAPGALTDVDTAPSTVSSRTAADDRLATVGYRLKHLSAE